MAELLPTLYLHGLSTGDFELAREYLKQFATGLRAGDALHLAIASNHGATKILTLDEGMLKAGKQFKATRVTGHPLVEVLGSALSNWQAFRAIIKSGGVSALVLPPRSPNLNAFAERWVKSVKDECLSRLILFGEASLRRALKEYVDHYHTERNHQAKGNVLLFPQAIVDKSPTHPVQCRERLGGLFRYYHRQAA